ncbi:MAG: tRNA (adenosine(37)-N6)-dimethylallyltransferase MiaA [Magnetococcales bacterium]|nr:tRNA (adenosine(37)-N6)-dimethylallyltransferase MiaA [Magnetococcales bacterium]
MNPLIILGATATGKTRLAVRLARERNGEIISADSRQVYRGLDIGTGKDLEEYAGIPCHLIDIREPNEEFSLFEFQRLTLDLLPRIRQRGRLPILAGGTGLYLEAIIRGYPLAPAPLDPHLREALDRLSDAQLAARLLSLKPAQHNTTDLENRPRMIRAIEIALAGPPPATPPPLNPLILGMRMERSRLRERIMQRLDARLANGMIEETRGLLEQGIPQATLIGLGLEYRFLTWHLLGEMTLATMREKLHQAICQYAKRQETWFRRMERQGIRIHWLDADPDPYPAASDLIDALLEKSLT